MNNSLLVKISVLMPVYNAELYIRQAIDSILNQTFTDFEFIIINDGSTDKSEDIIQEYVDSRIKYVKNDINRGLIYTLNKGLHLAKGKYIARMDADDISKPERFNKQFTFMEKNQDVTLLGTAFEYINTPYIIVHPPDNELMRIRLFKNIVFLHPSLMLRKSDIDKYSLCYKDLYKSAEDYKLGIDLSINGLKMSNLIEPLLEYRQHEAQISSAKRIEQETTANLIRKEYISYFFGNCLSENEISIFANSFTKNSLLSSLYIAIKLSKLNKEQIFDKKQFDLFLRELMYNSERNISIIDFFKAFKFIKYISFFCTFINILKKRKYE